MEFGSTFFHGFSVSGVPSHVTSPRDDPRLRHDPLPRDDPLPRNDPLEYDVIQGERDDRIGLCFETSSSVDSTLCAVGIGLSPWFSLIPCICTNMITL